MTFLSMYLPYPSENVEVEKHKASDWENSCAKEPGPVDIEPETKKGQIPLAPMGVLAPVSAHAGPSAQPPIGTSGNFPARVYAESPSNISPNPSEP